jgi:hypothetical protein
LRRFWDVAHQHFGNFGAHKRQHLLWRSNKDLLFQYVVVFAVLKAELPRYPKL